MAKLQKRVTSWLILVKRRNIHKKVSVWKFLGGQFQIRIWQWDFFDNFYTLWKASSEESLLYTHLSFSISGPSYFVRLVSKMKRLLLPSISLSKTTTKTMTNSMSLWLCTNNPTSLPLDPPSTIFFRIPQFPIEKSLSYTRVISYIHHDKNGGSCNFLAKKNKLPITRQQLSLNSN